MSESSNKVPEVTLTFWIIKIAATTLGETGGDTVTMTLNWGYLAGTALFLAALVLLVILQIVAKKFHPFLYWATIIASTTFGTTMADFADRSLGIGYTGGSSLLLMCLLATLALWYWSLGSINVDTVSAPKTEMFFAPVCRACGFRRQRLHLLCISNVSSRCLANKVSSSGPRPALRTSRFITTSGL